MLLIACKSGPEKPTNTKLSIFATTANCFETSVPKQIPSVVNDSLTFIVDSLLLSRYNLNVLPQVQNNSVYLLFEPNLLLCMEETSKGVYEEQSRITLPKVFQNVDDFLLDGDHVYYTANVDSSAIIKFNTRTQDIDTALLSAGYIWEILPFIGNKLRKFGDGFLLPITKTQSHFSGDPIISYFDIDFTLKEELGYGRTYNTEYYEPYFSTPITTVNNDSIFLTYSMNPGGCYARAR